MTDLEKKIEALAEEHVTIDREWIASEQSYEQGAKTMGEWAERFYRTFGPAIMLVKDGCQLEPSSQGFKMMVELIEEWSQFLKEGVDHVEE